MFPNCQRMNRGNYVISQLVNACAANGITDLIIVHEHRGEPGLLIVVMEEIWALVRDIFCCHCMTSEGVSLCNLTTLSILEVSLLLCMCFVVYAFKHAV